MDIIEIAEQEIETFDRPAAQTSLLLIDEIKTLRSKLAAMESKAADKPAVAAQDDAVSTLDRVADGLENQIGNAGLRNDLYDAGYLRAIKREILKLRDTLAAAPSHSQQSALTIESAKPIWVHGYEAGHNDGIGCGHSLAPRCRHSGENEFYEEDIKLLIDRCPSHESEQP